MGYELRFNGRPFGVFETQEAALQRAREALRDQPDLQPEIINTETGRASMPAGSKRWQDELASKTGF
jgi:non-canonical (house-cleaning) NTP pyrophosphatase